MLPESGLIYLSLLFLFPEDAGFAAVKLAHGGGELPEQLLLGACEVLRDPEPDGDELVPPAAAPQIRDALAAETEHRAGLRAFGDRQLHGAVQCGHLDLCAESRLRVADLLIEQDGGAVTLEAGMGPHDDGDQQVARRAAVHAGVALAAEGDRLPVVYAGRDGDVDLLLLAHAAESSAGLAGLVDDLAGALALGAGCGALRHAERRALGGAHLAAALAVGADLGGGPRGAAGAVAFGALFHLADGDVLLAAEGGLLEADVHGNAEVLAPARGVGVGPRGAAAEAEAAEQVAEDVAEVSESAEAIEAATEAGVGIEGRMAVLVILGPLVLIGEDLIGLVDLLEALLGGLVAGMEVRMVLLGKLSVCFFYLIGACALLDAEHLIVISFFCHLHSPL